MSQTHVVVTPPLWVSNLIVFFHLPNPRIFQLFIISSTATLSLSIAMFVEWVYLGRHHPGYHWIIYYAPSIMMLLVLVWIICLISANSFGRKHQVLDSLPILNQSKHLFNRQIENKDLHDDHDEDFLRQIDELSDFTMVPMPEGLISMHAKKSEVKDEDKLSLTRAFSFPLCDIGFDIGEIKRTKSFS